MTESHAMNLKLNNDVRGSTNVLDADAVPKKKKTPNAIKEERRRNGRYIAILVGIMLFLLATYHAWVRRIPIIASLVVPALIMFIYVGWVLYTASRDKHRLLDAEAALKSEQQAEMDTLNSSQNNLEVSIISNKDITTTPTLQETQKEWDEISSALLKEVVKEDKTFIKPVILINDRPPEDLDQKWNNVIQTLINSDKLKGLQTRKRKRRFCRSKRHAVFKRSYSIA